MKDEFREVVLLSRPRESRPRRFRPQCSRAERGEAKDRAGSMRSCAWPWGFFREARHPRPSQSLPSPWSSGSRAHSMRGSVGSTSRCVDARGRHAPGAIQASLVIRIRKRGHFPRFADSYQCANSPQAGDHDLHRATGRYSFWDFREYGLQPETILWSNYDTLLDDPHSLQPGQELIILPVDGVYWSGWGHSFW